MLNVTEELLLPGPDFFTFNPIAYSVPRYTFLSPGPYFADFKNVLFYLMLICQPTVLPFLFYFQEGAVVEIFIGLD